MLILSVYVLDARVWIAHIEYFSVCRWTVIVSLKRKALETLLKMKSLLDRCSFIQFIEYIGIGYLFCVHFPCDDFLSILCAHYAHTMAYAHCICVSNFIECETKTSFLYPERRFLYIFPMTSRKTKIFYLRFYALVSSSKRTQCC